MSAVLAVDILERKLDDEIQVALNDPRLSKQNRSLLREFLEELKVRGYTTWSRRGYAKTVRNFAVAVGKNLKGVTKQDIKSFFEELSTPNSSSTIKRPEFLQEPHNAGGVTTYIIRLKVFYKWINGGEEYPKCIRWLKQNNHHTKGKQILKVKEQVVSEDEYQRLLKLMDDPRDLAIVSFLWDSGARAGEILSMRITDLDLNAEQPSGIVGGKRRVPILESLPYLVAWMNVHPHRFDLQATLWSRDPRKPLSYSGLYQLLMKKCRRNGLRTISPHMLRHTRATLHAKHKLSPYAMNLAMGWSPGSKMYQTYIHLNGDDLLREVRESYGLEAKSQASKTIVLIECPRCHLKAPENSKFCLNCGLTLDREIALKNAHSDITRIVLHLEGRDEEEIDKALADGLDETLKDIEASSNLTKEDAMKILTKRLLKGMLQGMQKVGTEDWEVDSSQADIILRRKTEKATLSKSR